METSLRNMVNMELCARELKGGQREAKGDKPRHHDGTQSNRKGARRDKPRNHDGTRSSRRETKGETERSLEMMMELDRVEGRQRIMTRLDQVEGSRSERKGDKPGNHDETGSSRRKTQGDKPGHHAALHP